MVSDRVLGRWLSERNVALWGDVIRASLWGAVVLTWLVFGQIYARLWGLTLTQPERTDFTIFYYTARMIADGLPMYGTSPARYGLQWAAGHLGNLNPPHVQVFFQPLAWFSYGGAFVAWTLANLAALGTSLVVVVRSLRIRVTARGALAVGALLMAAAPFTVIAVTAELTLLLMLPATLAWAAARAGRWRAAGAWLGVCIAWKLFFLLFVPWLLLRRRADAVAAAIVTAAGVTACGLAVAGLDAYRQWLVSLSAVGWSWLPMNASWHGFVSRLFAGGSSVTPVVVAPGLVTPIGYGGAAVIAAVSLWTASRLDVRGRLDAAWLTLTLGSLLASPLGWVYYVPLAVPALWATLSKLPRGEVPGAWLVLGVAGLAGLYVPFDIASSGQPSAAATLTLTSSYFWATCALWASVAGPSPHGLPRAAPAAIPEPA